MAISSLLSLLRWFFCLVAGAADAADAEQEQEQEQEVRDDDFSSSGGWVVGRGVVV